jgi:prolipoprotein diacylglyceryltransferase
MFVNIKQFMVLMFALLVMQASQKNPLIHATYYVTYRRSTPYVGFGFFGFVVATSTSRAHIEIVRLPASALLYSPSLFSFSMAWMME